MQRTSLLRGVVIALTIAIVLTLVPGHVNATTRYGGYNNGWDGYYYPYYYQYYPYTPVVSYYPWWAYAYYFSPSCYAYTNQCYYPAYSNLYQYSPSLIQPVPYQLTVNADPSILSSQVTGTGTYSSGSSATFTATQPVVQVSQDTRYVFSHWTGDYSGSGISGTVTMDGAKTITAVFQPQYYLSVITQPSTTQTPLGGNAWYTSGDTATLAIITQTINETSGSRLAFNGWIVDGATSQAGSTLRLPMNGPHTVVAQYKQQYYLTVSSNQGATTGQGWYDAGSNAQISVTTPPSPAFGVNIIFTGWQGSIQSASQTTSIVMNEPMAVAATWRTDYTVLCMTLAAIIAILGVAAWTLFYATKRRQRANLTKSTPS